MPDLSSTYYHFFGQLPSEDMLQNQGDAQNAFSAFIASMSGINKLVSRWQKCIDSSSFYKINKVYWELISFATTYYNNKIEKLVLYRVPHVSDVGSYCYWQTDRQLVWRFIITIYNLGHPDPRSKTSKIFPTTTKRVLQSYKRNKRNNGILCFYVLC